MLDYDKSLNGDGDDRVYRSSQRNTRQRKNVWDESAWSNPWCKNTAEKVEEKRVKYGKTEKEMNEAAVQAGRSTSSVEDDKTKRVSN